MTAPKSNPGSDSILDMIKRGRSDDGSSVGFGLRKVKDLPTPQSAKPKKTLQELQEDPTAAQEDLLKAALGARFGAIHGQDDEEDDDTWDDF